ncbi:MAG: hypothetical protein LC808_11400 [Actinobacteria bacterium]|nr:hypothetical protein [Actinomycetota bacterium]
MKRAKVAIAIAGVALLLAGCSGTPSYSSVDELAQAMEEGGVACTEVDPLPKTDLVAERATCELESSTATLFRFDSDADRDEWLSVATKLGPFVEGADWAVTAPDESAAKRIADATGGDLRI